MILAPGQTHIHTVKIRPRNMFNLYPDEDPTSYDVTLRDHIGGLETTTLMVIHGTPVHQAAGTAVNVGPASVDVVTRAHTEYQLYDRAFKNVQQYNFMTGSNATITDPRTVLEDSDQPATVQGPTTGGTTIGAD